MWQDRLPLQGPRPPVPWGVSSHRPRGCRLCACSVGPNNHLGSFCLGLSDDDRKCSEEPETLSSAT